MLLADYGVYERDGRPREENRGAKQIGQATD